MRHAAALAVGVLVAVAALLVHRSGPAPLLLAVAASLAAAGWLRSSRWPTLCAAYCLGWVVVVGVVVVGRPEGDWLVGSDPAGYTMTGTAVVLIVLGVTALPARGSRGRT